jgi:hypothetical protein
MNNYTWFLCIKSGRNSVYQCTPCVSRGDADYLGQLEYSRNSSVETRLVPVSIYWPTFLSKYLLRQKLRRMIEVEVSWPKTDQKLYVIAEGSA